MGRGGGRKSLYSINLEFTDAKLLSVITQYITLPGEKNSDTQLQKGQKLFKVVD